MRIHSLIPATRRALSFSAKSIAVVGIAAAMTAPTVVPAQAFDAVQAAHFAECFGLLWSDPEAHAEMCLPSNIAPDFKTLAGASTPSGPPGREECPKKYEVWTYEGGEWLCECVRDTAS